MVDRGNIKNIFLSFFLLEECEYFLKYVCVKSGFKDFKILETSSVNLRKRLASMVCHSTFNNDWNSYDCMLLSCQLHVSE